MRRPLKLLLLLACLAAAWAIAGAGSASAMRWLCRPHASPNPCASGLDATVLSPSDAKLRTERTHAAARPPIDCFYVYPTVSDQTTPTANLHVDPQERAIARMQAA